MDQEFLLSSSLDGSIRVWNLAHRSYISTIEPSKGTLSSKSYPLTSVKFNPYERQFICSGGSRTLHLYDFEYFTRIKESRRFQTSPSHLEFESHGDFIMASGNGYMYCLNNANLETVASYSTEWKALSKMVTIEVNHVPHIVGFELVNESIKMFSNNYLELFPFRMIEELSEVKQPQQELTNYVVTKKPKPAKLVPNLSSISKSPYKLNPP